MLETRTDPSPLSGATGYTYTTGSTTGIPAGLIATITDPNGNVTKYEYYNAANSESDLDSAAEAGRLKQITVAYGTDDAAVTQFSYDQYGNISQRTDPGGRVTAFTYDILGRLHETTQMGYASSPAAGPSSSYIYNAAGQVIQSTDPDQNRTLYFYDLNGQLAAVIQPAPDGDGSLPGPETVYYYTPNLQLDTSIDPLGHWTQYTYNARNQLITLSEADPTTGLIDSSSSTQPGSPTIQYAYDSAGNVLEITDAKGNHINYDYDLWGHVTAVRSTDSEANSNNNQSNGMLKSYTYDGFGEVTSATVPIDGSITSTTDYTYDNLGRHKYVYPADPATGQASDQVSSLVATDFYYLQYDAGGRLTSVTSPSPDGTLAGPVKSYEYDHQNRVTKILQPDPATGLDGSGSPVTQYTYDPDVQFVKLTDPVGNVTTWHYDAYGRIDSAAYQLYYQPTNTSYPLGTRSYLYDNNGNLTQYTDRKGRVNVYGYDALGRRTSETWYASSGDLTNSHAEQDPLVYRYDLVGNLTYTSDPSSSTDQFTYDALNRQTSGTTSLPDLSDVRLTNGYDANGNRTSLSAKIGTTVDFVNSYVYDNLNQLISLTQTQQDGSGANAVAFKEVGFAYNDAGNLTQINRFNTSVEDPWNTNAPIQDDGHQSGALAISTYGYDHAGRLTSLNHSLADPAIPTISQSWQYDALNRVTQYVQVHTFVTDPATDPFTVTSNYFYDMNNQLKSVTGPLEQSFTYDKNGNRTSADSTSTWLAGNLLVSDGQYTYQYDAEGNETQRTDQSTGAVVTLKYDNRNRLIEVTETPSGASTPDYDVKYQYDTFNRRVSTSSTVAGSGGTVITNEKYVYDGANVVLDFVAGGEGGGSTTSYSLEHRYLFGPATDQILAQENVIDTSSAGYVFWMLVDNQGTVHDVVYNNGQLVQLNEYDAYGLSVWGAGLDVTRYGYTGRELDGVTGLQYNRERWYDPRTGRFVSEDPLGVRADSTNPYIYAHSSPTNGTDPNGAEGIFGIGADGGEGNNAKPTQFYSGGGGW